MLHKLFLWCGFGLLISVGGRDCKCRTLQCFVVMGKRGRPKIKFGSNTGRRCKAAKCRNASSATEDWLLDVRGGCPSADGSVVRDGEYVYVLPLRQIRQIDYFHGTLPGLGPVAQMIVDDGPDILASEMFSTRPDGRTVRAIITLQRRWRRKMLLEHTALIIQRQRRRKQLCGRGRHTFYKKELVRRRRWRLKISMMEDYVLEMAAQFERASEVHKQRLLEKWATPIGLRFVDSKWQEAEAMSHLQAGPPALPAESFIVMKDNEIIILFCKKAGDDGENIISGNVRDIIAGDNCFVCGEEFPDIRFGNAIGLCTSCRRPLCLRHAYVSPCCKLRFCPEHRSGDNHGSCMVVSDWDTDAPAFCGRTVTNLGY